MDVALETNTLMEITKGSEYMLGAVLLPEGTAFAVYSRHARQVSLQLFDTPDSPPSNTIPMSQSGSIWSAFVQGAGPGTLYGFKADGEYAPDKGLYFNPNKLLIDPYAKALTGKHGYDDGLLLGHTIDIAKGAVVMDTRDNARVVPKCVVVDDAFDWQGITKPAVQPQDMVIYETHVKGFTAHPSSCVSKPGTYLGFIEKIPYLKELGVTTVELLPVQHFHTRQALSENGLTEYWGYNTIGFFAPEFSYASGSERVSQVAEFKTMVRELHRAGIQVILDVVYNHTGEEGAGGPVLCFRGLDNTTYYKGRTHKEALRWEYDDSTTGCGNTLNIENRIVRRLVIDSLRYWTEVMQVDGFRFDLASVLGKKNARFSVKTPFFTSIRKEALLKDAILIAEPWDLSTYTLGKYPVEWKEWNGDFRDTMRRYLKGDNGMASRVAVRIEGSPDLYAQAKRPPQASINFITSHDGFTLHDLFTYQEKKNEANKENNRDGDNHNNGWNCGIEGPTDHPVVMGLRQRMWKNAVCCLFMAQGIPMICGGDEMLRTQQGNNNTYCQDNDISWLDWRRAPVFAWMGDFYKKWIDFRKRHPVLRRTQYFFGRDTAGNTVSDVYWFGRDLLPLRRDDYRTSLLCLQLDGAEVPSDMGDYMLFFILNMEAEDTKVLVPRHQGLTWHRVLDTSFSHGSDFLDPGHEELLKDQTAYPSTSRSITALLAKRL